MGAAAAASGGMDLGPPLLARNMVDAFRRSSREDDDDKVISFKIMTRRQHFSMAAWSSTTTAAIKARLSVTAGIPRARLRLFSVKEVCDPLSSYNITTESTLVVLLRLRGD